MPTKAWLSAALAFGGLLAAPAGAALTPAAEHQLDRGLKRLYALDYEEARREFRRLIELEPESPWGYLFESGAIWWHASMEYGLFKDTPTLQGLFEADVEAAIEKADAWTDSPDSARKADGHFVLGMALGTRGQWSLMRGQYVKAYFDGRKALKHLRRALKLDPEYYDAYLGLGVFDYQAARLSGVLRLSAVVGVRGDEKRGLERMRLAMERGRYAGRQAAQFLSSILIMDKSAPGEALPVVLRLREQFPESPLFMLLETVLRHQLGDWEPSFSSARRLFEVARADPKSFERKQLSLLCGYAPAQCLEPRKTAAARDWLSRAIAATGPQDEEWLAFLHLHRGYAHDALGRREDALRDYRRVLALRPFADGHARARSCIEAPCDAPALLSRLRALSRS